MLIRAAKHTEIKEEKVVLNPDINLKKGTNKLAIIAVILKSHFHKIVFFKSR